MIRHTEEDADEILLRLLRDPEGTEPVAFRDDLHARLAHAITSDGVSDLDLGVLVRHLLRRWSLRDRRDVRVTTAAVISTRLRCVRDAVLLREDTPDRWSADPWEPGWLGPGTPDAAAAAGIEAGRRFRSSELIADPFFERCTGYAYYRTPGQRAACRAVVSAPAGSTIIAMLPTGSGKTEVALCLADQRKNSLTLVVVPTVALAYDFERRFREHYARRNPAVDKSAFKFAWTGDTPAETREVFKSRVREGRQPLLVTSPESMTRSLRELLLDAAKTGRLGGLVIDEAHLVTQWGRDFRPEFRTLADLRRDLLRRAAEREHPEPTTLLLSATLGSYELEDLHFLFSEPGPCTLIAANALRAEPELWISAADDEQVRQDRVLEALARLPRPAVLYLTSPEIAEQWAARLREHGYRRLATVTGQTSAEDRMLVLEGLRNTEHSPASIDLVVATSAFGLGIDYPHIRTVVHACLPETVDRWYQELGRGGRDGHVSAGLLITAPKDEAEAGNLTTKVLSPPTAQDRWNDLWGHRRTHSGKTFVDLEGSRGVARGSYNRRWNAQVVQALVELDACTRVQSDFEERAELAASVDEPSDWVAVELRRGDLRAATFWTETWQKWQATEMMRSRQSLDAAKAVASLSIRACEGIARYYKASDRVFGLFGRAAEGTAPTAPCGRCPGCRRDGTAPSEDSSPGLPQSWPLARDATADLARLAAASGAHDGLILLTTDDHERVASTLALALIRRGVRHIAGSLDVDLPADRWVFRDAEPVGPSELTPCSSFVIHPAGYRVPGTWLVPSARAAQRQQIEQMYDVLLVEHGTSINGRQVGRELAALDAWTALEVIRS
ncbi:hypothetical protein ALI22I_33415 [Saccharothrix sp. ALI-22-I]|nr:hypothetical protein ALI22I_33415 [Saccharothrix sp. ALI-22-I]